MPTELTNSFTTYDLTEKEVLQGSILTIQQVQVLQNQRATIAEERLALTFDPSDITGFAQAEAYKKGQLDIISWLLDASVEANAILNNPEITTEV